MVPAGVQICQGPVVHCRNPKKPSLAEEKQSREWPKVSWNGQQRPTHVRPCGLSQKVKTLNSGLGMGEQIRRR